MDELDLRSVDEVLATARSVRKKLDFERPIEPSVILECIDLAAQAPTGAVAGESWRFVVATDAQPKQALARLYGEVLEEFAEMRGIEIKPTQRALVERLHHIPAMVLVCVAAPPPTEEVSAQVGFYGSILPAAWSLMLAFRSRGIGCTWTSLLAARQEEVRQILNMPEDSMHTVMLPIGYTKGAKLRRAERLPAQDITFWQSWDRPTQ